MRCASPLAASLYARLPEVAAQAGIMDASIMIGCAWTDSIHTSVSTIVVAEADAGLALSHAQGLAAEVWARRQDFGFGMETAPIDQAIERALADPRRPVFITDSGDNVTAGAAGDVPLCVERLLAVGARDALVAGLYDAGAVARCAAAGPGVEIELSLGGKSDPAYPPLPVLARVRHLVDEGGRPVLAVVAVEGVTIVIGTDRRAFTSYADIAAAGLDATHHKIVVVKQGYLFPDLVDRAPRGIMALTPGATDLELRRLALATSAGRSTRSTPIPNGGRSPG